MPAPLDVIIRKHVAPMAKQEGVPRKGRYFRLEGEHGHTLLYFDTFNLYQTELCFEVGFALLPLTYWDFTCQLYEGGGAPTIPGRESIFLYSWLMPPDEWSYRPAEKPPYTFRRRWSLNDLGDLDSLGAALAQRVQEEAFPRMRQLLDLEFALAELRTPTFATQLALASDAARELVLMLDTLDPERVEELLADPVQPRNALFEGWVRERVARRTAER
ncbi:hypothetical protein GCM10009839_71530 [Catenulispora yoronensis]|uniref:DUF4304 domain-containing protein n=1 Tax=Catenulispora yoronensis TaxID=450799 RepID=A0ABP5GSC3_9ACTN